MESTQRTRNSSAAVSEMTSNHNSDFCYFYPNVYFETITSTVPYTANAALNVFLAIVATFANVLVFGAVRHNTSLHLPSKLLLCSLILTDLGVALVVQPQFVTFLITKVKDLNAISCSCINSLLFSTFILSCVSLLIMVAISLDRYSALFFHLKYSKIVTTK